MPAHEQFEELCALAASGQISPEEWLRLREHLDECASCAEALGDFGKIGAGLLSEFSETVPEGVQAELRSRFLSRARETGAELSYYPPARVQPKAWKHSTAVLTGVMAASVLLAIGGIYLHVRSESSSMPIVAATPRTQDQTPTGSLASVRSQDVESLEARIRSLEEDRRALQGKLAASAVSESSIEERLKALTVEIENKNRDLTAVQAERSDAAQQLLGTRSALERADAKVASQDVQLKFAKDDVKRLGEELVSERTNAEQARALLAAGKDGQGILAARNLHIVDVYDADTAGKRRSFGRIFYVENQELIFYAYDLSDPRHANAEFYAWGAGLSPGQDVARLGILHNDGQSEKRWVLKYNDAAVLAKLDSIFVTAEMAKNPERPKGRRVLFAVLAGQPNHP